MVFAVFDPSLLTVCINCSFLHLYPIVVAQHALTLRLIGKRSRSHSYKNRHGCMVASDGCCYGRVLLLQVWVCMLIRLPMFSSFV